MQTFIGVKKIKARPMTRQEYNDYRGWALPADEDGSDDGLLVEYIDGGGQNHPDHEGYISWSPAGPFERAYRVADTFRDRMLIEIEDITTRLGALQEFRRSDACRALSPQVQGLLDRQAVAMGIYSDALEERLALCAPE